MLVSGPRSPDASLAPTPWSQYQGWPAAHQHQLLSDTPPGKLSILSSQDTELSSTEMEAECESEVQVASVALVQSSEEETLSAETQETENVEMSSSENNIETSESQETSQQVSVSVSKNCLSFESEAIYPIKSVTKTEEEIVRESSEIVEVVEEDLKTQEMSEHTEEKTIVGEAKTQSSDLVTQKTTIVGLTEDGNKVFKVEFPSVGFPSNDALEVDFKCSTSIVITNAEGSTSEVQKSFVSTKEIVTDSNENVEKMESVENKSGIEVVHEESSEETKEIIESNQCMEMQAEEQTSLEVEKFVSNEKIICQVNEANDADEVPDSHDEVPGGETDEQSATPDLIKACNEINKTMNGSATIMEVNIKIIHCHSNQYFSPFNSDCEDYLRMNAYRRLVTMNYIPK